MTGSRLRPLVLAIAAVLVPAGCAGGAGPAGGAVELSAGSSSIRITETGAVVVDKREVGRIEDSGRVITSTGSPIAWLYNDQIRLLGGAALPIKTDRDGAIYVPESAQEAAGLTVESRRIRPDGTVALSADSKGVRIEGASGERARRATLLVLIATKNELWQRKPDEEPPGDLTADDGDLEAPE